MPVWLLGALLKARSLLVDALAAAIRNPMPFALAASLVASVWLWHGWNGEVAKRAADKAAYTAAQAQATAQWAATFAAREKEWKGISDAQQAQSAKDLASANAMADRAIAAGRVRLEAALGKARQSAAASKSDGAPVHDDVPTDAVLVDGSDVRSCTDWVAFGMNARDYVLKLAKP